MTLKGVFLSSIAALAIVLAGPVGAWQRPVADAGSRSHSAHARQTEWLVTNPRRDTAQGLPGRLGHASPLGGADRWARPSVYAPFVSSPEHDHERSAADYSEVGSRSSGLATGLNLGGRDFCGRWAPRGI
jgi:hypothetical protein